MREQGLPQYGIPTKIDIPSLTGKYKKYLFPWQFHIWSWLLTFTIHLPTVTTVEELVNMASGKPVQLVYFDENNRLVFDHDGLSKVIESNNLCGTPLALLPIGGAVRSGKSLLISLIYSVFQYFASVSVCLLCKYEHMYVCWWLGAYFWCSLLFEWISYLISTAIAAVLNLNSPSISSKNYNFWASTIWKGFNALDFNKHL